ncbi:MAG: GNAT family N-acetyltransferase [Bacteroidales bacterium]|nr:GNAT family N-acetyltransferase [Bacteroidales bacterium]
MSRLSGSTLLTNNLKKYKFVVINKIEDFTKAKELFKEYENTLNFDFCFQDFETELKEINVQYYKPFGGLILIRDTFDKPIGCAGIRKFDGQIAELKRMYLKDAYRNIGLGKKLLIKSIELAKKMNYTAIRLDTLKTMKAAIRLYEMNGFKEIDAYRYNPSEDAKYYELKLIY